MILDFQDVENILLFELLWYRAVGSTTNVSG